LEEEEESLGWVWFLGRGREEEEKSLGWAWSLGRGRGVIRVGVVPWKRKRSH
jgi:hypothetical protein